VVVGGWVLRYLLGSVTGAYFGDPSAYFAGIASGLDALAYAAVFMTVTVAIVASGVEDGIERATTVMVPAIVVLLVVLAAWAATLEGAGAGYDYFLSPEFDELSGNLGTIVPFAVGQAFFSLSLGMGIMLTYSSYVGSDDNMGVDAISIVVTNTLVGVLAGFVVFPLLFAQGVEPGDPGSGAIFVSIATAFARLPAGEVLGLAFFGVVAIAAFSSSISLLEVGIAYVVDNYDVSRPVAATAVGAAIFLVGVPTAMNTATLGTYDAVANSLLLPVGVLLVLVFVGWVYDEGAVAELRQGIAGGGRELTAWLWHVRTVLLVAVVFTLGLGVAGLLGMTG
jgi:NSS family neurotransmitter:Na+ symporter